MVLVLLNVGSYTATGCVPTVDILFCKLLTFTSVLARLLVSVVSAAALVVTSLARSVVSFVSAAALVVTSLARSAFKVV